MFLVAVSTWLLFDCRSACEAPPLVPIPFSCCCQLEIAVQTLLA